VFASPYIRLIALLLVLLNVVNTTGEFILSHMVTARADTLAAGAGGFDKKAYIGAFYGNYFLWVNMVALVLQGFVASRLVKLFGLAGVLFALPLIALGAYGVIALGATLSIVRWAKTAENSADYSVMNTAKQMMWLPTSREEKYKAKQVGSPSRTCCSSPSGCCSRCRSCARIGGFPPPRRRSPRCCGRAAPPAPRGWRRSR
jgi:AAA family ATP:ADP antiporter